MNQKIHIITDRIDHRAMCEHIATARGAATAGRSMQVATTIEQTAARTGSEPIGYPCPCAGADTLRIDVTEGGDVTTYLIPATSWGSGLPTPVADTPGRRGPLTRDL